MIFPIEFYSILLNSKSIKKTYPINTHILTTSLIEKKPEIYLQSPLTKKNINELYRKKVAKSKSKDTVKLTQRIDLYI